VKQIIDAISDFLFFLFYYYYFGPIIIIIIIIIAPCLPVDVFFSATQEMSQLKCRIHGGAIINYSIRSSIMP
jgi:hypothetical protein